MRQYGITFRPDQCGWIDFETVSPVPIKDGTYRYMREAEPLIFAFAIGDAPAKALRWPLTWQSLPPEVRAHQARVTAGEAVWAAYNAAFDREVWNQLTDFPPLEVEDIIDVMAQAVASGLPASLDGAARYAGVGQKASDGKKLIQKFIKDRPSVTQEDWTTFLDYAANDVEVMRGVFRHTLQLPLEEWEEYWTSERINLTGIRADLKLCERAAKMAVADKGLSAKELTELTDGTVTAVTQVQRMIPWLQAHLNAEDAKLLVVSEEKTDEDTGEVLKQAKHSLDRNAIRQLILQIRADPSRSMNTNKALRVLELREFGGSTTPAKFGRMLATNIDGELLGSYVFNGAPQTGRFSSRIVQIHNLMRDALPYELDAIDSLLNGTDVSKFAALGDTTPVSRKLSMLIRPTLIPADGNAFVWGDWSQIEARVLPWLACAEQRLNVFREVDENPKLPDLYTRTAAAISGVGVTDVTKPMRQRGKVTELACGFAGGKGALQKMAASYGMHLDDETAQDLVSRWRAANPWAPIFWREMWEAMRAAQGSPGTISRVGRISFSFLKDYLGGTLLMFLPSGRCLVYRALRWEDVDVLNDAGEVVDKKLELTFARDYGRMKIWPGIFVENATQAVAADVLRQTLVSLDSMLFPKVRAHTHDEVLVETHVDRAEDVAVRLVDVMETGFYWSEGLPLKAEASMGYAYSKCPEAQGL